MNRLLPDFGGRVSRRDIALSPAVWIITWGTFAMFAFATALLAIVQPEGIDATSVAVLSGGLGLFAVVMSQMDPPEPDTGRTHALLALTYIVPMLAVIAFRPQGSAVAITTAFAGPLTSVWMVDRRQIVAHLSAATVALFLPCALGLVDDATFVACLCIAPTMWALALTCVVVLESAEAQGTELAHMGKRDPLTGAGNRRLLDEALAHELLHQRQAHRPFTILTFDLNGFKALNDTVGHAAGDELLRATAEVLLRTARPTDTVVRTGGDEFTVILPGTTERDARVLAEVVRARLQAVRAYGSGISTGIGIATCPKDGDSADLLLAAADARLLADKAAGRDGDRTTDAAWDHAVPESSPRLGTEPSVASTAPAWTIEGVSRKHLEALRPTWRAAAAVTALYALIGSGILVWAPELGRSALPALVGITAFGMIALLLSPPPKIGSLCNHAYVVMPYAMPAAYALATRPGAMMLGLSMFVGPVAAVRLLERRQIMLHLAAATLVFSGVLAIRHDELPTVLSLIIVIGNLWVLGFSCVFVLESSESQGQELARVVRRDPLTRLGNRRRLRERLEEEIASHAATGKPLTVVTLDLNGFKQLNDTIGHAAGDALLQRVADALRLIAAAPAEAMRQGGDEFAVLLPDTTADEAVALTAAIARSLGTIDEQGVRVTTGLGTATFPADGDTVDALLDRADLRLRTNKYGEMPVVDPDVRDARRRSDAPEPQLD